MRPLPTTHLEWAFPGIEQTQLTIRDYAYHAGSMPLTDLAHLCRLTRHLDPKVIFEIGTYEGETTLQLALNSRAEVFTLDLPPDAQRTVTDEELDVYPPKPGARYADCPEAARIRQLYGDSQTFDFSPWYGRADLVFVDASHQYEHVKKDTATAFRLLAPCGAIAWHDYGSWAPGVVQALEETLEEYPLVHLAETSLAVYFADKKNNQRLEFEWVQKGLCADLEAAVKHFESGFEEMERAYDQLREEYTALEASLLEAQAAYEAAEGARQDLTVERDELAGRYKILQARVKELEARHQPMPGFWGLVRALPGAAARGLRRPAQNS